MLTYTEQGLIPAIAQDANTGQVLMVAFMNQESLQQTLESGQAWFWSRSRQELWHKGATSGNYLNVRSVTADCDGDVLLLKVEPAGPACHTGAVSCFFNEVTAEEAASAPEVPSTSSESGAAGNVAAHPMEQLFATIEQRKAAKPQGSYVAGLLDEGTGRVAKKVVEEAGETMLAAVGETDQRLIEETADLWFHSLILLSSRGLSPQQVWEELERRRR